MKRRQNAPSPPRIWIVAADAARARIFRARQGDGALAEIDGLLNPAARMRMRERVSDRQGHAANAARGGGYSLQRNATEARQLADSFARRLARRLTSARRDGEFDRLYLLAEPHLLGVVRGSLDAPTRRLLAGALDTDLTRGSTATIRARLPERL